MIKIGLDTETHIDQESHHARLKLMRKRLAIEAGYLEQPGKNLTEKILLNELEEAIDLIDKLVGFGEPQPEDQKSGYLHPTEGWVSSGWPKL